MKSALIAGLLLFATPALAQNTECGLCDEQVTMTAPMAKCFLGQVAELEKGTSTAVAVDLSSCQAGAVDRGVVEALPSAQAATPVEPTMQFMLARRQISCLKEKLQDPALVLDPSATIKLDACNGQATGN